MATTDKLCTRDFTPLGSAASTVTLAVGNASYIRIVQQRRYPSVF